MKITLDQAVSLLNGGLVVGIPTETVYGLAASINFPEAIGEIFRLKGRPSNNPLIVHVATVDEIAFYAKKIPPNFKELASAFWPGPMTLIIPIIEDNLPSIARAGLPTAGFRIPKPAITRELLKRTGPLVMPSANISGSPSATTAEHVEDDFGSGFSVLDGGQCDQGMESTILCWNHSAWSIIRLGALAPEDFLPTLGYTPKINDATEENQSMPLCPGQLYRHYSPIAKLHLLQNITLHDAVIIGFSDRIYPNASRVFLLGNSNDPAAAAHELYAILRTLDDEHIEQAFVDMNFPNHGLWLTLRERLLKASTA